MEVHINEIYKWMNGYKISRQIRNIEEDFSDAVPLAEILKDHFPKIVNLHNYNPKTVAAQKVVNWVMLNKKVLNKLNINLAPQTIDKLAKSTPGVIDSVLLQIKTIIQTQEKKDREYVEGVYTAKRAPLPGLMVPVEVETQTHVLCKKLVTLEMYDAAKKDIEDKDHRINLLKAKVTHLESLLIIKDDRIKNLQDQVQKLSNP
ncbi:spermatogenesis-associated 4-related [Holotrichia oblita]|uniref:Spermatogenesis-associated 4-related n=1 Tax=Holotrichia oblita TaxID=644536 RepID=A0ACB9SXH1_HOLOL|nr:spermatogenesis-associated 4-related [Holotrichia oblita]